MTTKQESSKSTQSTDSPANPADYLARLIAIERQVRKSETVQDLRFTMVNWSHRLIPYSQGVLCEINRRGGMEPMAVSGVVTIEPKTPFSLWVSSFAQNMAQRYPTKEIVTLSSSDIDNSETVWVRDWKKWEPKHLLFCPLNNRDGTRFALLLLFRKQPFDPRESSLMDVLIDTYSHAWCALDGPQQRGIIAKKFWKMVLAGVLLLVLSTFFISVPETVLAPAEIVPQNPIIITSPVAGQIKDVAIFPYEMVHEKDLLFQLDDTEVVNQLALAEEGLEIVKADYLRTKQQSFRDPTAKGELEVLRLQVREKQLQAKYYREELVRQRVYAPQDGLVIFRDRNDWLGRPVAIGEKVMTLADPTQAEVEISMAVDDAISLEKGAKIKLFLRTDPLHPLTGTVTRTSYKAEEHPEGGMFFTLKAKLEKDDAQPRIGLQGTVKIYGGSVRLIYYLFRKPLAIIRRNLGV